MGRNGLNETNDLILHITLTNDHLSHLNSIILYIMHTTVGKAYVLGTGIFF